MLQIGYYALILCILGEENPKTGDRYYPDPEEALRYFLGRERIKIVLPDIPKRIFVCSSVDGEEEIQLRLELDF